MPLISIPSVDEVVQDMITCQIQWQLSDTEMGRAVCGEISDPGKTVRGWKTGTTPTPVAIQAFKYLKALVQITNNSPLCDAEENYGLAHSALPAVLQ